MEKIFIKPKNESEPKEDPKKFLEFEKITQPTEDIIEMAKTLKRNTEGKTLENVLNFLGKNIKYFNLEMENPKE